MRSMENLKQPHEECPICLTDLRGAVIPDTDPPEYYSKLLGVEVRGEYDGVLFYECPYCEGRMHRFRAGTDLWHKAERYV